MELKDITVDLEISKELKEKGFSQDGLFTFYQDRIDKRIMVLENKENSKAQGWVFLCSAPTTDELLDELPPTIKHKGIDYWFHLDKLLQEYGTIYAGMEDYDCWISLGNYDKSKPCNALAKMWIYLKDNGLLK